MGAQTGDVVLFDLRARKRVAGWHLGIDGPLFSGRVRRHGNADRDPRGRRVDPGLRDRRRAAGERTGGAQHRGRRCRVRRHGGSRLDRPRRRAARLGSQHTVFAVASARRRRLPARHRQRDGYRRRDAPRRRAAGAPRRQVRRRAVVSQDQGRRPTVHRQAGRYGSGGSRRRDDDRLGAGASSRRRPAQAPAVVRSRNRGPARYAVAASSVLSRRPAGRALGERREDRARLGRESENRRGTAVARPGHDRSWRCAPL